MKHTSLQIIRDEHASLAAMLQSMRMMVDRGPADNAENFFDVMRAMLFYIDEFPERLHHPKESNLLFPRVAKAVPLERWFRELRIKRIGEGPSEVQRMVVARHMLSSSGRN